MRHGRGFQCATMAAFVAAPATRLRAQQTATYVSVKHVQAGACTGRTFKSRESRLGGNMLPKPGSGIITPSMEFEGA